MTAGDTERPPAGWLPPVAIWAVVAAVLWIVSAFVIHHWDVDRQALPVVPFAGDDLAGGWCRFDCGWYTTIADKGYSFVPGAQSTVAFFPGYPLAIRAMGRAVGDITLGGVVVTLLTGCASLVLFWRWCLRRMDRAAALTALALLAVYPYSWYLYGAVYGDALFVLTALLAFMLVERDRPVLAGVVAAASTATRLVGVATAIALVVIVVERRRRSGARPADAGVLLGFGGLVAWLGFLWHRFGDPFLFSSVQQYWGQPSSPRTWFKIDAGANLLHGTDRLYAWGLLVQGVLAVAALVSSWFVAKRFGLGYGVYTAVLVGLPAIGSQDFQGLGRYVIGAFPAFALAGEALSTRPRLARFVLPASALALVVGTGLFAQGQYLS